MERKMTINAVEDFKEELKDLKDFCPMEAATLIPATVKLLEALMSERDIPGAIGEVIFMLSDTFNKDRKAW